MLRGMYTSLSAMINLQTSQNIITNNIANVNTTGYKSEKLISKAFNDVLISNNDRYINGKSNKQELGTLNLGVKIDEVNINYLQGTLVETNNETDFAINGNGFFTVIDNLGSKYYTRDGVFNINSEGYLVNGAGYELINTNNQPIYIGNSKINIDNDNNINLDSGVSHKFNIVDFDDYNALKKVGQNFYSGDGARETNNYELKSGYKEASNVDIIEQTSDLMSNLRAFEANQKVVQVMDSTLDKIASEIGVVR